MTALEKIKELETFCKEKPFLPSQQLMFCSYKTAVFLLKAFEVMKGVADERATLMLGPSLGPSDNLRIFEERMSEKMK